MNETKNNKVVIVVISILVIVVLALGGYILYDKVFEKSEVKEKNPIDNKEEIEEEVELFDDTIKEEISQKISILENIQRIDTEQRETAPIYKKDTQSNDLSSNVKLGSVLDFLYFQKATDSPVTTDYDFSLYGGSNDFTQLDQLEVENAYYNLYGNKNISHQNIEGCPLFIYDSNNQKYYGAAACGGTTNTQIDTYISKYTTKEDYLYAYVSFAVLVNDENASIIYTDYERQNQYSNGGSSDKIINANNYNEFSQYKYTFIKNSDGSYSFDKIERQVK